MVADVDIGDENRFKLYWAFGDPATGKWKEAWLVDHRRELTSWAHPWSAARGESIHLVWNWMPREPSGRSGAFHVERTGAGFGPKVRVVRGDVHALDAALDPVTGRLLLVSSTDDGVFVASRPAGRTWTRSVPLHPSVTKRQEVSAEPAGEGAFVIRTGRAQTREWLLTAR